MSFYNFEWSKEQQLAAQTILQRLAKRDETIGAGMQGILLGCVITSRSLRKSPSARLEKLITSRNRPTSLDILDAFTEAFTMLVIQLDDTCRTRLADFIDTLTPRNLSKEGRPNATVIHALEVSYEAFLDLWSMVTDFVLGFRSVCNKVLNYKDTVNVTDYLYRGMTRSQLLKSFGDELNGDE